MEQKYANLGRRVYGGVIDLLLVMIFLFSSVRIFGTKVAEGTHHITGIPALMILLAVFLYFVILEATTGRTIGKYIAHTRVVNKDGQKIGWGQSFVRNIMRVVDGFAFYIVGIIAIGSSEHRQRLGDMLAKTYVIDLH